MHPWAAIDDNDNAECKGGKTGERDEFRNDLDFGGM